MYKTSLILSHVLNKHAPVRHKRVKRDVQPPWFNSNIYDLISKRDRSKCAGSMQKYRKMRNFVINEIGRVKSNYFRNEINKCHGNSSKLWNHLAFLSGKSSGRYQPTIIKLQDEMISDPMEIANVFNTYFANIATTFINKTDKLEYEPSVPLQNFVMARKQSHLLFEIPFISKADVFFKLRNLNPKKGGSDQISSRFLRHAAYIIAEPLSILINKSIECGTFPGLWKCAKIVALHKGGETDELDNFRPISILCAISKVMEKHVHDAFLLF